MDNRKYSFSLNGSNKPLKSNVIYCPNHQFDQVVGICQKDDCHQRVFCIKCQEIHNYHIPIKLDDYLNNLCLQIKRVSKKNYSDYYQVYKQGQNKEIIKYLLDYQEHLKKVENHFQNQKLLINDDIQQIIQIFTNNCQQIKTSVYEKLDLQLQQYKEQFMNLKEELDSNYYIGTQLRHCINSQNLIKKLQQVDRYRLVKELNSIQNSLKQIRKKDNVFVNQKINVMIQELDKNTVNLPVYYNSLDIGQFQIECNEKIEKMIYANIQNMIDNQESDSENLSASNEFHFEMESFNKSYFDNQIVSNQRQKIQLIEEKKVQFENQIDQLITVKNGFVLNNKNKMIFYNTEINQFMLLEDVHYNSIKGMFYVNCKHQSYIFSQSNDKTILQEVYENNNEFNIVSKTFLNGINNQISSIYGFRENHNIILGDNIGSIYLYDIVKNKLRQLFRGQHQQKIVNISDICVNNKHLIMIGSFDNIISLWIPYQDNLIQQKILKDNFRNIKQIMKLTDFQKEEHKKTIYQLTDQQENIRNYLQYNQQNQNLHMQLQELEQQIMQLKCVIFNENVVMIVSLNGKILLYSLVEEKILKEVFIHRNEIQRVLNIGRFYLSYGQDCIFKMFVASDKGCQEITQFSQNDYQGQIYKMHNNLIVFASGNQIVLYQLK